MVDPVRIAVVGVGHMGRNHARCLASMKDVHLVAVVDPDETNRAAVAEAHGCLPFASIEDLPEVDAAVVAVPTGHHLQTGQELMSRGVHCLIEKPLTPTRDEAGILIAEAENAGVVLQVGHVERFNPAVRQLRELVEGEQVLVVNARRMSAVSARVSDIDVVMDLMVHDIDVVLYLMGTDVAGIEARAVEGPHGSDHVTALLGFGGNRLASLTASRITQNQVRQLEVTTADRFLTVDYPSQELLIFRQGRIGDVGEEGFDGRYALDVETRRVFVRRAEPLVAQLEHFAGAVRGDHPCEVDGRQALAALELVWSIQDRLASVGSS
ncbi:MAG: oxidoreductase [Acidimicrobiaceae bacterium]|nr:oxidoreductase [Acidimicrobiaceae bacterium]